MSDVCLVLEGTYPYVRGGVSAWVHRLVTDLDDLKFTILSIMPTTADTRVERYEVPPNVQSIINVSIHDYPAQGHLLHRRAPEVFEFFNAFHRFFRPGAAPATLGDMEQLLAEISRKRANIDFAQIFSSREFWDACLTLYRQGDATISFLDFFWNYRFTFLPLLQILKTTLPPAPLYHTISTGYAGFSAALAKIKFNSSMVLTEHGIYTKERRIEIAQASWLYEREQEYVKATEDLGYFREWWIGYFNAMSRITYAYADLITTLYEGNRQLQIADGAEAAKTRIIANGVDVEAFRQIALRRERGRPRRTLAFVGRVVPIKDVKTLIKACKIIVQEIPDVRILLLGPQEEEGLYFQECLLLIRMLGLEKTIVLTGHVDVEEYYPAIDVVLLTSISEAMPLVILEAAACGIPSVATDVGACREMLEGKTEEDRLLGHSGIVTPFYSPQATASAAIRLLTDDALYEAMSQTALQRTTRYYDIRTMTNAYRNVYEQFI